MTVNPLHRLRVSFLLAAAAGILLFGVGQAQQEFDWQQLGDTTYSTNCAACHQADGTGIPGAFPPLSEQPGVLAGLDGGRELLIHIVLFGLQGPVKVSGSDYNGMMPAWPQLSDEQIAATINHILASWQNPQGLPEDFKFIQPDEITTARDLKLSVEQVHEAHDKVLSQQ